MTIAATVFYELSGIETNERRSCICLNGVHPALGGRMKKTNGFLG
jgi:hypothetical protein